MGPGRGRCGRLWFAMMVAVAAMAWAMGLGAPSGAVPILHLDIDGQSSSATVDQGETFTVEVLASDIPAGSDSNGMFGFGVKITFTAPAFSATTPIADALWTGFVSGSSGAGQVGLTANRLGEASGPSGDDILLGSFQMEALTGGVHALTATYLTGPGDNLLFDGTFLDSSASFFQGGSVTVLVTPEPGLAALLACGCLALGLRGRRFGRAV